MYLAFNIERQVSSFPPEDLGRTAQGSADSAKAAMTSRTALRAYSSSSSPRAASRDRALAMEIIGLSLS